MARRPNGDLGRTPHGLVRRTARSRVRSRASTARHAGASRSVRARARLKPGVSVDIGGVLDRARTGGVAVEDLAAYCAADRPQAGLVFGCGAIRGRTDPRALRLLARGFQDEGIAK
ncbi:hypothetical protein E1293_38675 [Actinomadura darangshiensis]|uniref:Uncharacterized protein n=1 Tax=Actinomadura darangshiensis TaxID=705336 RepID=A0A4R5AAV5_9ACTN|nr:hypothetical protein [Actinomadura darangshiensis]TDD66872.1 hypothetical protein E1293_38675 [Actinomadura darangshiensis]